MLTGILSREKKEILWLSDSQDLFRAKSVAQKWLVWKEVLHPQKFNMEPGNGGFQ